jgi:hypothetical protein
MRFRKLRIAWSVAWGVMAVLLVALWVRSYRTIDEVYGRIPGVADVVCSSDPGRVLFAIEDLGASLAWTHWSQPTDGTDVPTTTFGFWAVTVSGQTYFALPHWLLILAFVLFSAAPWLPWRFSLRTLLIATTLVAVVLGLVVYAAGK